ncbi:LuxR C-terminal-related transcriptional regulator [Neptunomonas sp.]|uniref:LuxR C-terminal-related transcriptional regulator n=2 Tax=Neptunomonas sp. TaxID=1971898 RepID=UPI00356606AF
MKLYIVSANKEVISRWAGFAEALEYSIEVVDVNQLSLQKFHGHGCGLVHISSLNSASDSPVKDSPVKDSPVKDSPVKDYLLDQLCVKSPLIKWVALSDQPSDTEGLSYLASGFRGYINTYVTKSLFHELLNVVMKNDIWAGPSLTQRLMKQYLAGPLRRDVEQDITHVQHDSDQYGFTDREDEVLDILITGASNKEIARELGITERTIKAHVASLLHKTGTKDRVLLILKLAHQTA